MGVRRGNFCLSEDPDGFLGEILDQHYPAITTFLPLSLVTSHDFQPLTLFTCDVGRQTKHDIEVQFSTIVGCRGR